MSWLAILTLINDLGTIGTWCSSPSHVIHPTCSSVVLPLLSFGTLRSLGSSLSKMSLVFFRTNRAWEWFVFARLACFSWKQKRFAIFVSLEVQLKMASLKSQYHFVRQFCCCAIFLSSDCVTNSLYSNFFAFATFRSIFSLMKCLRNSRTSLSKVYYFTVALEATLVGKLLSCWRIYVLIVYLLGHVFLVVLVDLEVPYLFFHCAGISALCDWTKSTQRSSCFNSQWNNHFFQFVLSEPFWSCRCHYLIIRPLVLLAIYLFEQCNVSSVN